jgi:hypothetical protein
MLRIFRAVNSQPKGPGGLFPGPLPSGEQGGDFFRDRESFFCRTGFELSRGLNPGGRIAVLFPGPAEQTRKYFGKYTQTLFFRRALPLDRFRTGRR